MLEIGEDHLKCLNFTTKTRNQFTIGKNISFEGVGVFTGKHVTMTFYPAKPGFGVQFKRLDLPNKPLISADASNLKGTSRCTILENNNMQILCVEHVLSALYAFNIDNLLIEIDGMEPPMLDGSSLDYSMGIEKAKISVQDAQVEDFYLQEPCYIDDGRAQLIALPSQDLRFSYTLSYPNHPLLSAQFYSCEFSVNHYISQVAPCRTFILYDVVKSLIDQGLIKSDSLSHGVVIDGDKVLNKEGLRFSNEMARHKVLDMMGDLFLAKKRVIAHFVGVLSGHGLNTLMAKQLYEGMENLR
ncbi:MAG: UDP-3-O-acyl-N-acetylglucosamine deacetylase [Chlamydiia bacterium]|nr:UDP-3-O-acyl-N-acetylglucosamine deacetylase [Chlamydiia bacterium]